MYITISKIYNILLLIFEKNYMYIYNIHMYNILLYFTFILLHILLLFYMYIYFLFYIYIKLSNFVLFSFIFDF